MHSSFRLPAAALAVALLPLVAAADAKPQPARDILPFKATEKTLPNGLRVIVVPTGLPNLVALHIPVQTGSRNEFEAGKSGFAHFFEHMMFRGTKEYPPEKYQAVMTAAGARNNAYTTDDFTNYHATFAKEDLETILKIEADRFQNLSYAEPAFRTEATAVLGEYNKNSQDPVRKLIEVQREQAYTTHTYKHTTLGFLKDIEDMPNQFAYAQEFFKRWYRPEYTTVIVSGDVDPAKVMGVVEKYWGTWKRGTYTAPIPAEPAPKAPVYAHVAWPSPTSPWVTVGFRTPAFGEKDKTYAAADMLYDLTFGDTSELYQRLVEREQKVDRMFLYSPATADPGIFTVFARVKDAKDVVMVRDAIIGALARAREELVPARRLADAQANARYGLARTFDSTESIAGTLARYVRFRRSYGTLNELYRQYDALTPEDLRQAARTYATDNGLVVTTLSKDPLDAAVAQLPKVTAMGAPAAAPEDLTYVVQKSQLPQVSIKLTFLAGSAHDPQGKEGLAQLTGSMIADAGSRALRIDEIRKALFPLAGRFDVQVDKEMATFTASVHRDNLPAFLDTVLPMLTDPGYRDEDFTRLRDQQKNELATDLRTQNEEELGKERLQQNLFVGTPYGHPVLGSVAGIEAITLDDVKAFAKKAYTRKNLTIGLSGDLPADLQARLSRALAALPEGPALAAPSPLTAHKPEGLEIEILQKDTRSTAISFGHPIAVTRSHPDFAALSVARAWLGEHRSQISHLYNRIREVRGMNYGDYAYIEAFPRGGSRFFPDPNVVRRAQIFEVWIRPVMPENAHHALRIAQYELAQLVEKGLSKEEFESVRGYLMKNTYVLTGDQDHQLGYALDSKFYGTGEFVPWMREKLGALTVDDVNKAIRAHLSATNLSVVIVTKDAEKLREALVTDAVSKPKYEAPKPADVIADDEMIGARKLGIAPAAIRITPIDTVFAK